MHPRGYLVYEHIRGGAAVKSVKLPCPGVKFLKTIPCSGGKLSETFCALKRNFVRSLSKNVEMLPSKRFESDLQSANGLKTTNGVQNDTYGPCHGADLNRNDTLSGRWNPEDDTLFRGTSP